MRRVSRQIAALIVPVLFAVSAVHAQEPPAIESPEQRESLKLRFAGARHFVMDARHALRPEEREALEASGCRVEQNVAGGRYLVALRSDSTIDENDPRVRSLTRLTSDLKMQPSAWREVAKAHAFATVRIVFSDDTTVDSARAVIEAAGGAPVDPMQLEFSPNLPNRVVARIPSSSVAALAADEQVLTVYGPVLRMKNDNATSALLSNITPLFDAPYGLTGEGVQLTYFELGAADTTHNEFQGRLTSTFTTGSSGDSTHATHVAGTMIAAGITPRAKGMAPKATLQEFNAGDRTFLTKKGGVVSSLGAVADNNSWGYVLGWNRTDTGDWIWTGNDEFIAAYDDTDAAIDKIARSTGLLMVHSSGNEGAVTGPFSPPYAHQHEDDNGSPIAGETFCYSEKGNGTDCPAPCSSGTKHCETVRHPTHVPFGSLGLTAGAKNIIAVGATDASRNITGYSSRGPARDGRVKPDLVARGGTGSSSGQVYSTIPSQSYGGLQGTSMSSPVVTGASALVVEQWRRTFGGATPNAAMIKSVLIAGADDVGPTGPDYSYGFGFLNAKATIDLIRADGGKGDRIRSSTLAQGATYDVPLSLSSTQTLRVVAVWTDPEVLNLGSSDVAATALVNDLDLKVIRPDGSTVLPYVLDVNKPDQPATRGINKVDNTEEVEITGAQPGNYRVVVTATKIAGTAPSQPFILVANAGIGQAAPPCSDIYEPNDTPATAFGFLPKGVAVLPRICSASDVDYFSFRVNRSGPASVVVTTKDTPLRVTITGGSATVTADIPAGSTQTVTANIGSGIDQPIADTVVLVRVEANGTVGTDGTYQLVPSYSFVAPARNRTAHR